ncbi:MAG: hypothetical protein HYX47_24780 [Burkholderiales bacterium]|nr:hypothetical protein [Burkholderiales bacterium]
MNEEPNAPSSGEAGPQAESLSLRASTQLGRVPAERPEAPPAPAAAAVPSPVPAPEPQAAPMTANAQPISLETLPQRLTQSTPPMTWAVTSVALIAGVGWLYERRRRRLMEMEKDSVLWADVQPHGASIVTTAGGLDDILPDSPDPAEAARAIYVTAIGDTNSRREATLIDLHQLEGKLGRRRNRGDVVAAVLLLQQHLVDFRYTSPWVFLELRDLYKVLDREKEWDDAREVFKTRFGQNAPAWSAPSTEAMELVADQQLCGDIVRKWPFRETRMFILRWMLGEHEARHKSSGPPLLGLGVYRDMMFLDSVLDEAMEARPAAAVDSLL